MEETVSEYLEKRYKPENINKKHKEELGTQDKIALFVTGAVGTMYAVYFFLVFMFVWMAWQTYFSETPFDPYPFAFLLFIGNLIQLILIPLIMIGQNVQGKHAKIRADEEFKTTQSSFKDIEQIIIHLKKQDEEMKKQREILESLAKK